MKLKKKPKILKIRFNKAQQKEVELINKNEPVPIKKVTINKKRGYTYEYTTNRKFSYCGAQRRLIELYGGRCSDCGKWPNYKAMYDMQGAWLVRRYCESCFSRQGFNSKK